MECGSIVIPSYRRFSTLNVLSPEGSELRKVYLFNVNWKIQDANF
jgi:hypothetical protein